MKKFTALIFTLLISSMASATPWLFEEGKHYEVVAKVASAKPTVTEYFSFYCPHCFKFEFVARQIEDALPEGASFAKSHVDFMRTASSEVQQSLTSAMVTAEKMGVKHKIVDAIFSRIHKERKAFKDDADIRALFAANGVDVEKFDKLNRSFAVQSAAKQMKKAQDDLSRRQVLTSVPTFIVNNKYKILPRELRSVADYNSLVEYLLAKK
jgi:thiol:disulfide interchange protein DsbA